MMNDHNDSPLNGCRGFSIASSQWPLLAVIAVCPVYQLGKRIAQIGGIPPDSFSDNRHRCRDYDRYRVWAIDA